MTEKIGRAPGDLAILQSFVNTLDIEQSSDELSDPAALQSWLNRAGFRADNDGRAGDGDGSAAAERGAIEADLAEAIRLREALRQVLRSHVTHGLGSSRSGSASDAAAKLREISGRLPTRLDVGDDGRIRSAAAGSGTHAALARIMLIAAEAATLGTWDRLKVCSADDCQWAFYDRSPTRNGCWCTMQICGSRAKSRAYRSRMARPEAARR
jgi:predicted RNA-binding Zn ribbon-like protein